MKKLNKTKGFTLIEMLVVIAIVAILVALVMPMMQRSARMAQAATDGANMRIVHGYANAMLMGEDPEDALAPIKDENIECKSFPGADLRVVFYPPAFIDVYFVDGENYYGTEYFSDVAATGKSDVSTEKPADKPGSTWYSALTAEEIE